MSRLGELLVREKLLGLPQLTRAEEEAKRSGVHLGHVLAKLGLVDDQRLAQFVADQYRIPQINLADFELDADVVGLVPRELARRHLVIPISRAGATMVVAMADPSNIYALDELKFLTQYNIEPVVCTLTALEEALARYYDRPQDLSDLVGELETEDVAFAAEEAEDVNVVDLEQQSGEAPVVKLCNLILLTAIKKKASDIHIEPYEKELRIRYRIDGILYEEMRPPLRLKNAITSRVKIMASLDISERRLPQDGRIKLKIGKDKEMDFRVSVLPTLFGEKIVLRLLDKSNLQLDMTKLGFEEKPLADFKKAISLPYGMVLVTGPTGSGKTTTLYSALSELNKTTRNISTAEDPVEFNLPGINQVHMHEDIGLSFAAALRAFLRQDPNIIMVGEIRDLETAEIGVKAALTGHLVLSTLHTNDAPSTITRLLNMGIEPFLVTSSVNLVVAQRLARKICGECKEPAEKNEKALLDMGVGANDVAALVLSKGRGCKTCNGTGYKGRIALYEVMPFLDPLKELVLQGSSAAEIKAEMIRLGVQSLRVAGIRKMLEGVTTPEEIMRVTVGD